MQTRIYIGLTLVLAAVTTGVISMTLMDGQREASVEESEAVDANFTPAESSSQKTEPADESVDEQAEPDRSVERVSETAPAPEVGQSDKKQEREEWDSAVLQVVTNFEKADVTINGLPYPEYTEEDEPEGMVLPAGGPHIVRVTYEGKTKTKKVFLEADETLIMMFELSGMRGGGGKPARAKPKPRPKKKSKAQKKEDDENSEDGRVTVYSKPNGEVLVDGKSTNEQTPGTIEVEPGRHSVQVKFDSGEESEKKIVRVRKGSRIKLFFRQQNNDDDDGDE